MSLKEKMCLEAVALVESFLRQGYAPKHSRNGQSAVEAAAREAITRGIVKTRSAFRSRLSIAEDRGIVVDESCYVPARYVQPPPKAVIKPSPPAPDAVLPQGPAEIVLAIGDLHQDPRHPHRVEVLKWIARFGADQNIPRVVQIGDWGTFDSVSGHERNDTMVGKTKPPIDRDLDNLEEGLAVWNTQKGDWRPKQDVTLGNHEHRIWRYENANPESYGTYTNRLESAFASFGWRTTPYGQIRYIGGVGFTHHPTNAAGRAYGGKTGPQRAAGDAACSLVGGHTHRLNFHTAPKIGTQEAVQVMEIGCAIPTGEIEQYAKHSITGWWHGVVVITCQGGHIVGHNAVPMTALRECYSDDGA